MERKVTLSENGRAGHVTYHEGSRSIIGSWEFGGGDVVAIVSMGGAEEWRKNHGWAPERRAEVLRFVADEVIRQKAPRCTAEIDGTRGDIVLRQTGDDAAVGAVRAGAIGAAAASANASWVSRYREFKGRFAVILLVAVLGVGLLCWLRTRVFVVQGGKGVPMGSTLRTDTHLATLIQRLQPYTPSLHHDPSIERFTLSVFLVPMDGSTPTLVRLVRDLQPGGYSLARVIGSDGGTMWIGANETYGVDLETYVVRKGTPPPNAAADNPLWMSNPPLTAYLSAGLRSPSGNWLGLQSQTDLGGAFRPGRWLRAVESATDASRDSRRLVRGELGPEEPGAGNSRQIRAITPIGDAEYRNAAFLRDDEKSEPRRLPDPDSVLMLYTSAGGFDAPSTSLVSRVEIATGRLLWTADTGIHRFKLEQILPADRSTVFVGPRPPVPDKLSEPLLVILEHATGKLVTHSLWQ